MEVVEEKKSKKKNKKQEESNDASSIANEYMIKPETSVPKLDTSKYEF
jgi:hypothetical protein